MVDFIDEQEHLASLAMITQRMELSILCSLRRSSGFGDRIHKRLSMRFSDIFCMRVASYV